MPLCVFILVLVRLNGDVVLCGEVEGWKEEGDWRVGGIRWDASSLAHWNVSTPDRQYTAVAR